MKIGKKKPSKTVKETPKRVLRKSLDNLKSFIHKEDWEYYDRKLKGSC